MSDQLQNHPFVELLRNTLNLPVDRCFSVQISVLPGQLPQVEVGYYSDSGTREVTYHLSHDGRIALVRDIRRSAPRWSKAPVQEQFLVGPTDC